jgi:hypothetical protein
MKITMSQKFNTTKCEKKKKKKKKKLEREREREAWWREQSREESRGLPKALRRRQFTNHK